jgi:hypothetical protein
MNAYVNRGMFMAMHALPHLATEAAVIGQGYESVRYENMDTCGRWRGSAVDVMSQRGPRVARLFKPRGEMGLDGGLKNRAAAGIGAAALVSGLSLAAGADEADPANEGRRDAGQMGPDEAYDRVIQAAKDVRQATQDYKAGMEKFADDLDALHWTVLAIGGVCVLTVVIGMMIALRANTKQTKEFLKRLREKPRPW